MLQGAVQQGLETKHTMTVYYTVLRHFNKAITTSLHQISMCNNHISKPSTETPLCPVAWLGIASVKVGVVVVRVRDSLCQGVCCGGSSHSHAVALMEERKRAAGLSWQCLYNYSLWGTR